MWRLSCWRGESASCSTSSEGQSSTPRSSLWIPLPRCSGAATHGAFRRQNRPPPYHLRMRQRIETWGKTFLLKLTRPGHDQCGQPPPQGKGHTCCIQISFMVSHRYLSTRIRRTMLEAAKSCSAEIEAWRSWFRRLVKSIRLSGSRCANAFGVSSWICRMLQLG